MLTETGGHFDFHQADRMFATLTIILSSVVKDRYLIVKQDAREATFKYEQECVPYYTAFYCDCKPENAISINVAQFEREDSGDVNNDFSFSDNDDGEKQRTKEFDL